MNKYFLVVLLVAFFGTSYSQMAKVVQGTLVDERSKDPIDEVHVVIQNVDSKDSFNAITNTEGYFKFKTFPWEYMSLS